MTDAEFVKLVKKAKRSIVTSERLQNQVTIELSRRWGDSIHHENIMEVLYSDNITIKRMKDAMQADKK